MAIVGINGSPGVRNASAYLRQMKEEEKFETLCACVRVCGVHLA